MLTDREMRNAYFAENIDMTSETEECTPRQLIASMSMDEWERDIPVMLAAYADGKRVLEHWKIVHDKWDYSSPPDTKDNQIAVDAGYIATNRMYGIVTFVKRGGGK